MLRAIVFREVGTPLRLEERPIPSPGHGQILLRVAACGICRTDLHIMDGELSEPKLPLIPGHQIIGQVVALGSGSTAFRVGVRVGVPWLGATCGSCEYCREERENLCDSARCTGYHIDGGFAEYAAADQSFCFAIPEGFPDLQAAPLLCAGLIGYRSLRLAGSARRLGIYGFGAAAHIVIQVACWQEREVYAFTRPGDQQGQAFARELGAVWAGGSDQTPPEALQAAIIFAPAGELVPSALKSVRKGGTVVCAGIHMSDIPSFPYQLLWGERMLRSVANLTRRDGSEFLEIAQRIPVRTEIQVYPLTEANRALADLRAGRIKGAGVLEIQ
jgi:propanol-preferring alcohol dehydrogenase